MKRFGALFLALTLSLASLVSGRHVLGVRKQQVTQAVAVQGIDFPSNGEAGSAMRIVFSGANRPSRTLKTVIWSAYYEQQTGYYSWAWDSWGDNDWHSGSYEAGCHPFPTDGSFNGLGASTGSTGGEGEVHYYEIAGAGDAVDWIATPGGSAYLVTKGVWVKQAFTDEPITVDDLDDTIERKFYVDLSDLSKVIVRRQSSTLGNPGSPIFAFGSSEWRDNIGGAGITDEASSGPKRNLQIYSAKLSTSDIVSEANRTTNTPVTSAGATYKWYSNISPTPDDISDKSGAGHNPSWANANHGTLWTP